jgi:hypothetical protein
MIFPTWFETFAEVAAVAVLIAAIVAVTARVLKRRRPSSHDLYARPK